MEFVHKSDFWDVGCVCFGCGCCVTEYIEYIADCVVYGSSSAEC